MCEGSGPTLFSTVIHTGLPHHLPEPACGGQASLSPPLLLEGLSPSGHQGSGLEGNHRLAGFQGRPRPLMDPGASLGPWELREVLWRLLIGRLMGGENLGRGGGKEETPW